MSLVYRNFQELHCHIDLQEMRDACVLSILWRLLSLVVYCCVCVRIRVCTCLDEHEHVDPHTSHSIHSIQHCRQTFAFVFYKITMSMTGESKIDIKILHYRAMIFRTLFQDWRCNFKLFV